MNEPTDEADEIEDDPWQDTGAPVGVLDTLASWFVGKVLRVDEACEMGGGGK